MNTPAQENVAAASPASRQSALPRVWSAVLALVMGYLFVVGPARELWRNYWLVHDGRAGTAVLTKAHWGGHGVYVYRYRVNGKDYTGQDRRSYQNAKYEHVTVGEETVVYYSASHPSLSAVNLPAGVMFDGLPVVLLAWLFEFVLIVTVIDPKNWWSLSNQQVPRPAARAERADFVTDRLKLLGWGLLLVLGMAALVVGVDLVFGRK